MAIDVLVTGAYGRCGTALVDHLQEESDLYFTYLDRSEPPADHPATDENAYVADVTDYEAIRPAFDGQDAVVHLAGYSDVDGEFDDVLEPNVVGTNNVLAAAQDAAIESVVFTSSNHVLGAYETELAPDLYELNHHLELDHTDPVRPDSYYGVTKVFGENLGRYYIEDDTYPKRVYALRIGSVRSEEYDHPYGDAERRVEDGEIGRDSKTYERTVNRMKAIWQSRRDFAHEIECCLRDDHVNFGIFNGVSDNDRRWLSIEHARELLGYDPKDNGERWGGPPEESW